MSVELSPTREEVLSLLEELGAIKEILREASRQLVRMERRVSAAMLVSSERRTKTNHSDFDERSAEQVISNLKERITKGEQIETYLKKYRVKPELQMFARLLGMTNAKLPPKDELVKRIATRLRQSVSVTRGFHELYEDKGVGERR